MLDHIDQSKCFDTTHRGHVVLKWGEMLRHPAPDVFDKSLLIGIEAFAIIVEGEGFCAKDAPLAGVGGGVAVEVQVKDVTSTRLGREQGKA